MCDDPEQWSYAVRTITGIVSASGEQWRINEGTLSGREDGEGGGGGQWRNSSVTAGGGGASGRTREGVLIAK